MCPPKKIMTLAMSCFLLVKVMDEPDPLQISGKIVWISPPGALGNRPRGVGVQFTGDTARKAANMIENRLGATISLTRSTHTM